jgi:hypothetical protein
MPVKKPVGAVATFTAVVTNAEGMPLPDALVTFTDDSTDPVVVDPANAQVGKVTGTHIEVVTVTATVQGAVGPLSATDTADFRDNVPAAIVLTAS